MCCEFFLLAMVPHRFHIPGIKLPDQNDDPEIQHEFSQRCGRFTIKQTCIGRTLVKWITVCSVLMFCSVFLLGPNGDEIDYIECQGPQCDFPTMEKPRVYFRDTPISSNFTPVSPKYLAQLRETRYSPQLNVVNCQALFNNSEQHQNFAQEYMVHKPNSVTPNAQNITSMASNNCNAFRTNRGYITQPLTQEEAEFPIAYSILMYKDVSQVERLLRAVYMPQNFYCIHIDSKATQEVKESMRIIANCFSNVFIASRLENVVWGHISIMYAEMSCIKDLLQYNWKYFINLSGQMFPLHTNAELVKILKVYNGANDVEGTFTRANSFWLSMRQIVSWRLTYGSNVPTMHFKGIAPHNITIYKGSNQVALNRDFVEYFMRSSVVRDIIEWFSDTQAPDEYIWPSLNHNPHLRAPGGYTGDVENKVFTTRATIWIPTAYQVNWSWKPWTCHGKWTRGICIFGVGDLPWLYDRPELFANKLYSDYQYLTYDCMEQLIFDRTLQNSAQHFDLHYYENLDFVKHSELVVKDPWVL